ncbi:hypothetical protein ANAPRD1_01190 [Anaplasma phagocytophilum]|uniref:hypothetical protein n=1 Tax=Anaplasma phagocytophilum TaxID=948 RepID=UPI0007E292FE|nr:hypothetical protein [Anaplasma phagocytophilum]SCV66654.1 hypothetical protein ANAPRD1_01190 [Anaplasma phagocytophilum]
MTKRQGGNHYGVYALKTEGSNKTSKGETSLCGDDGGTKVDSSSKPQVLKDFVAQTLKGEKDKIKNWPTSTKNDDTPSDTRNDNAKAVAKDLTKLTSEEKTIVAGLLAKTIEGGEVVEIRAVSSTYSMVNLGYRN